MLEVAIKEVTEVTVKSLDSIRENLPNFNKMEKLGLDDKIPNFENNKFNTINQHLKDEVHPVTKVPFVEKTVVLPEGKEINIAFPDFGDFRAFETALPEDLLQATDNQQAKYCENELKKAYDTGDLDTSKFSEGQLEQIADGQKPKGYTWHHNEDVGRMELVDSKIHQQTAHTGGRIIWGGGADAR